MKRVIQAGRQFVDLNGEPVREKKITVDDQGRQQESDGPPVCIGKTLGNLLMQASGNNNDDKKIYLISIDLNKGQDFTVDRADFKTLIDAVEKLQTNRITKAQIQFMLDEAEEIEDDDEDEKKKKKK